MLDLEWFRRRTKKEKERVHLDESCSSLAYNLHLMSAYSVHKSSAPSHPSMTLANGKIAGCVIKLSHFMYY